MASGSCGHSGGWCWPLVFILLAAAIPARALEPVGPESEAVLQKLREQKGEEPTAEDLINALNWATFGHSQDGKHALAETIVREALALGERNLGREHPAILTALNNLAFLLKNQGHYDEAEPLYLRALESGERILGQDHPQTLTGVSNLAMLYKSQGRYGEAESLNLRTLEARERILGQDHLDTLVSVGNLAGLYREQGRYDKAEELYLRAVKTYERVLGRDHPDTLLSINSLADLYLAQDRYGEAEPLYLRALAARERILGQDHPQTLDSIDSLAVSYSEQGRYGEAEPLFVRVLKTNERALGQDHPATLQSINNLAGLYARQGRYDEAEPLYLYALEARERVLGKDHAHTLFSVNDLAMLYRNQGRYGEAEPLLVRAFTAREQVLDQDHPDTLQSLHNLALLYHSQGRYDEAGPLYARALEANERVLGRDHSRTLGSADNLAALYKSQGRYGEAEPLFMQVLDVRERLLGRDHPDTLVSAGNLAGLYRSQGRYDKAELLYLRVLDARERLLGRDHPRTLVSINNLAVLYEDQGRYGEAEPLFMRVLNTRERVLGRDHPDTLASVNHLAGLYRTQGHYGEAEPLFVHAIEGQERILGRDHPDTLTTRLNLVPVLINLGYQDQTLGELRRVDEGLRSFIGTRRDPTLRKRVRRHWLLSESDFQNVVFSLALQHPDPDTLQLAADVLLRWKRSAEEAEALIALLVRSTKDPKVKEAAGKLAERRSDLSRLVNQVPDDDDEVVAHANAIVLALNDIERLEVELAGLSREYHVHRASRAVDWGQVRSGLPADSALLSLRAFNPVDLATGDSGDLHWLTILIPAVSGDGPEILLKNLGPIASMEAIRRELRATGSRESARMLYRQLFGVLDAELAKYKRLYISSDGTLDLVAFARLQLPDGRYWVERQGLHRIQTGRDLVASGSDPTSAAGMVVYGGVDYAVCSKPGRSSTARQAEPAVAAGGEVGGDRMPAANHRLLDAGRCFEPPEFSDPEAGAGAQFSRDPDNRKPEVWQSRDASESRLESLASPPRILHLATHGCFLDRKSGSGEHPLALAGLALAGADDGLYGKLNPAGEDGILAAPEAQDPNLEGTELVTLSVCDTDRGEVDDSEDVYGLVRAFRIAGARNVLMSLWKPDDLSAPGFMKDFYAKWFEDDPERHPAEALRKTQLAWIGDKDSKHSDPKYWAPFVLFEGR